ncbi:protein-glutamate O-methyltransferase CheR [Candidatus Woesearchaeota archaeon]|nr:protein-glutamate O-methyltransferase CheR [Candidatus Woesearchaeota archaeon]
MLGQKKDSEWEAVKNDIVQILQKQVANIQNFKSDFIQTRVKKRMMRHNTTSYKDYLEILKTKIEEQHAIIQALSIHVTHFFRDKNVYEVFLTETIMKLLKEKQANKQRILKIWSAGCSSGEEPYSIAMIFLEILQDQIKDYMIDIKGTDISSEMIELAKRAAYEPEQLKETPQDYIDKYFQKVDDKYYIKEEVKKLVRFEVKDIWAEDNPRAVDIIFCRNTMIYFSPDLRDKLFLSFHGRLLPEGFMVLGMTEILTPAAQKLFEAENNLYRIYKKRKITSPIFGGAIVPATQAGPAGGT